MRPTLLQDEREAADCHDLSTQSIQHNTSMHTTSLTRFFSPTGVFVHDFSFENNNEQQP